MVTKSRKEKPGTKEKIKVLSLKKETVKDLTGDEARGVKGGIASVMSGSRGFSTGIARSSGIVTSSGATSGEQSVSSMPTS